MLTRTKSLVLGAVIALAVGMSITAMGAMGQEEKCRKMYWNDGNCNWACGAETCYCVRCDPIVVE